MAISLDQLLDATGLDDLSGRALQKQASAPPEHDLSKLAEQLRRASEVDPVEELPRSELIEKTAAIAVLERTLEEIEEIQSPGQAVVKTAAPVGIKARFIKEALAEGYSPVEIAAFLKKEAFAGKALAKLKDYAGKGYSKAKDVAAKAGEATAPAREGASKTVRDLAQRAGMTEEQIARAAQLKRPALYGGAGLAIGRMTAGGKDKD